MCQKFLHPSLDGDLHFFFTKIFVFSVGSVFLLQMYKTAGKITVVYVLIHFLFLGMEFNFAHMQIKFC